MGEGPISEDGLWVSFVPRKRGQAPPRTPEPVPDFSKRVPFRDRLQEKTAVGSPYRRGEARGSVEVMGLGRERSVSRCPP